MDRRTKYTINTIKETFLNLLEEKELNKITVSEVCKLADINRATFYRYYIDIYDLLDKIENDFVTELKNTPDDSEYTVFLFAKELLEVFVRNKKLVKILFNTNNNIYFLNDILEIAYDKCKTKWLSDNTSINETDIEYAAVFIFNGALGIINYWVKNDFDKNLEEIAHNIEDISYYGIKKFLSK